MVENQSTADGTQPTASAVLAHRVDGAGPPVLLLNGGMMTIAAWDPVAQPLAAEYQVIRCDFRGQLLSPATGPRTMAGHVEDVRALLDHLGLARVHVVGTSFGSEVGLLLAATDPDRVASLVLATVTDRMTLRMHEDAVPLRTAARAAAQGGDKQRLFALLEQQIYSDAYRQANAAALERRRALALMLPATWFAALDGIFDALDGLDLRPALAGVRCPTLVLVAGEDRSLYPEHGRAVVRGIAGAELEEFDGSGHALIVERTGPVLASIRSFLQARGGTIARPGRLSGPPV